MSDRIDRSFFLWRKKQICEKSFDKNILKFSPIEFNLTTKNISFAILPDKARSINDNLKSEILNHIKKITFTFHYTATTNVGIFYYRISHINNYK